ncbi:GNAT family N-acetyltransferase [Pseudonocardia sp.]|uniref:GNAT family N-acetyltransferase n=1 Tax=Pseudonocardia sp. TaxID=60912 RepID=UPI00260527BB|nr:GNAT family N-acetyltransferase [Pseudonocardia sp.]
MPHHVTVRPRRPDDVDGLVALLAGQQAQSRYPLRWPLPFPVEDFLVRETEERAWVAEVDGAVAGHVAVARLDRELAVEFARLRPGEEPAAVTVLFTGAGHRGRGVGGALHDTAVAAIRGSGRLPVLDVLPGHSTAVEMYRHRGWTEIGRARPGWLPAGQPDVLLMVLPEPVGRAT